jgi:uncharacterized membrane protein
VIVHSIKKSALLFILLLVLGSGLVIGGVGLWKPALYTAFPILTVFMRGWLVLVLGIVVYLLIRLSRSDTKTALNRKYRQDTNWQMREERISRGLEIRQRAYSRETMLKDQKEAERRARWEAAERRGVSVQFKPDRGSGN